MSSISSKPSAGKKQYPEEIKVAARSLYLRKYTIPEIELELSVPKRTLYYWQEAGDWEAFLRHESVEEAIKRRITLLAEKDDKSEKHLNEMDRLIKQLNALGRYRQTEISNTKLRAEPSDSDMMQNVRKKMAGAPAVVRSKNRKNKIKNDLSFLTEKDFEQKWFKRWYKGQRDLYENQHHRNRFCLKSRQIGFTWYFSQEALIRAVLKGEDQIFLSATRRQAEVFRKYIRKLVAEDFDIELSGNPILLNTNNGKCGLHFLSNNSMSAQSESGHVYIDEAFWIRGFDELYNVATAMATHKHLTRTIFSTPSVVNHEA
ncbi:terminase large subunit domain-containing protein [Endozoicomonas ascidiicola]|uniref:terminase large subunit domain-containing protein n=1 Tax=Endozoicomonas ascidiicola TaxID=1698521 RepID=UPI000A79225F|nr:terminase family protein [Endozoicomonas ascidiicola]